MSNIILASKSKSRQALLAGAGIDCICYPANIDEDAVKRELQKTGASAMDLARRLSHDKALLVSTQFPNDYVIGGDQTLDCDGRWFDKPTSIEDARQHLQTFRNKTHTLQSGICVAKGGKVLWDTVEGVDMVARDYSDDFIDHYLKIMGDEVLETVGAYKLEGMGAQLFTHVKGDYFTVLGIPMLSLLHYLRSTDLIKA